jgi:hypothetical protein
MILLAVLMLLSQDSSVPDLIHQLQSEKVEERESATRALRNIGRKSVPDLERASHDKDAEVSRRACEILARIDSDEVEATFLKIEGKIEKATSVRIRYALTATYEDHNGTGEKKDLEVKGELLAQGGTRIRFGRTLKPGGKIDDIGVISDGNRAVMVYGGKPHREVPSSKDYAIGILIAFTRLGSDGLWPLLHEPDPGAGPDDSNPPETDEKKLIRLSEFRSGEDDGRLKTMTYKASFPGETGSVEVKLWYAPDASTIAKRELQVRTKVLSGRFSESYQEFALDTEIPDSTFDLGGRQK